MEVAMKKILFLMTFLVVNLYTIIRSENEIYRGDASQLINSLQRYIGSKYRPATDTIEIYVTKPPSVMSKILTVTRNKNTRLLEFICNDPGLASHVRKISFEKGLSILIPPCIEKLVNLKSLILRGVNLGFSNFQWRIPSEIGNLKNLEILDLRDSVFYPYEKVYIKNLFGEDAKVDIQY